MCILRHTLVLDLESEKPEALFPATEHNLDLGSACAPYIYSTEEGLSVCQEQ